MRDITKGFIIGLIGGLIALKACDAGAQTIAAQSPTDLANNPHIIISNQMLYTYVTQLRDANANNLVLQAQVQILSAQLASAKSDLDSSKKLVQELQDQIESGLKSSTTVPPVGPHKLPTLPTAPPAAH